MELEFKEGKSLLGYEKETIDSEILLERDHKQERTCLYGKVWLSLDP